MQQCLSLLILFDSLVVFIECIVDAVLDDRMAPKTAPDGTLMEPVEPKADEPAPEENSDTPPKDAADEPAK